MTIRSAFSALISFLLLLSVADSRSQTPPPAPAPIEIGKSETMHSNTLGEDRRILVSLPGSAYDTYFYKRRYPVVYLLDGDTHFFAVTSMIRQLSETSGATAFPEMIVVGIPNTDRNRDLTPTHAAAPGRMDSVSASHTGGGEKFLSFIAGELMPHIDSLYPTAPYRILIGHSLGGLTVMYNLVHHPDLFNAYIAIDPSMSWDDQRLLNEARSALTAPQLADKSLFLAIANSTRSGMPPSPHGVDTAMVRLGRIHYHSILKLRDYLTAGASAPAANHLRSASKYYPEYDHSSVPLPAEYDGLRYIFSYYDLDFPFGRFFQPGYPSDTLISAHYREISRRMGYRVSPPEPFINNLGYSLLGSRQYDRAYLFFKMNVDNYPGSFNVYDSMGDYYVAIGDKDRAIASFIQCLSLRENPDTRSKLQKLRAEK